MYNMHKDYLEELNRREDRAWEAFYNDYYVALCADANKFLHVPSDAEDVVQDTCVKIWESDNKFATMKEFTWYVYKSVYTNTMYYLRTRNLHQRLLQNVETEETVMPESDFILTIREELIRLLHVYIAELPHEAQKIMKLSLEGMSGNEIAEKLNISVHTVKSQKNRSFKYLRERLSKSCYISMLYAVLFDAWF